MRDEVKTLLRHARIELSLPTSSFRPPPFPIILPPSSFILHPFAFLLFSHLSVTKDNKLGRRQLFQPHRSEGMNLTRTDANLSAQAELAAVVEACRSVDDHRRGINPVDKFPRSLIVGRHSTLGMLRAVAFDMIDRIVHVFN